MLTKMNIHNVVYFLLMRANKLESTAVQELLACLAPSCQLFFMHQLCMKSSCRAFFHFHNMCTTPCEFMHFPSAFPYDIFYVIMQEASCSARAVSSQSSSLLNGEMGRQLDATEDECCGKPERIPRKILQEWLEGKGLPLMWESLIQTLRNTGLLTLADKKL